MVLHLGEEFVIYCLGRGRKEGDLSGGSHLSPKILASKHARWGLEAVPRQLLPPRVGRRRGGNCVKKELPRRMPQERGGGLKRAGPLAKGLKSLGGEAQPGPVLQPGACKGARDTLTEEKISKETRGD